MYIPFETGSLLISDRLNSLYGGQKTQIDKIIQISPTTVIGFSGPTEICKHLIDLVKINKKEFGVFEICEIIRNNFIQIKKEAGSDSVEFLLVRNDGEKIRLWKIVDGISNELESDINHAIGMYSSIIPNLELRWQNLVAETALQFGANIIGWTSKIESGVGSPAEFGCNVCYISKNKIQLDTFFQKHI